MTDTHPAWSPDGGPCICPDHRTDPTTPLAAAREGTMNALYAAQRIAAETGNGLLLGHVNTAIRYLAAAQPARSAGEGVEALDVERFQRAWSGHMLSGHAGGRGFLCGPGCADDIAAHYSALAAPPAPDRERVCGKDMGSWVCDYPADSIVHTDYLYPSYHPLSPTPAAAVSGEARLVEVAEQMARRFHGLNPWCNGDSSLEGWLSCPHDKCQEAVAITRLAARDTGARGEAEA